MNYYKRLVEYINIKSKVEENRLVEPLFKRDFISNISNEQLRQIQRGVMKYEWRGVLCNKNPFDMALYQMLMYKLRPATIIEIGSKLGGSALWLHDLSNSIGFDSKIICIDIAQCYPYEHDNIEFIQGDARNLSEVLDEKMKDIERPLLVIEDADHQYLTTMPVLNYFGPKMQLGEYILVEDGVCESMGNSWKFDGGPNRAVVEFLKLTSDFDIDTFYCDYYGKNVTWNPNGYLKKVR